MMEGKGIGNSSEEWIRTTDHKVMSLNPETADVTITNMGQFTPEKFSLSIKLLHAKIVFSNRA
jgi:hypothetical protein